MESLKIVGTNKVILIDSSKIICDTEKVVIILNNFFVNIGNTSNIEKDKRLLVDTNSVFDPVLKVQSCKLKKH